ncbi:hypothetical protein EWU23_13315 [Cytophagaceae bacterium 50C-KIRBA]|uniref:Tetratricopeptide repeat protein n=1 Tax=Aquirufa beregesia TaxID=2516556 RepID=A0ABX0EZB5_9BACT|nr:hypothetical protein [Aquirufa beregesia]NGZ45458.1 hypothetical protein [Aquirufa beregesia]
MKNLFFYFIILISTNAFSQTTDAWDREYLGEENSYVAKGDALLQNKRFFEAIQMFNKSIEINNKNFWTYFLRGSSKTMLDDNRGALIDLITAEDLLNLDKSSKGKSIANFNLHLGNIYFTRGIVNIKLKNKNEGCLWLSRAGELGDEKSYLAIQKFCK